MASAKVHFHANFQGFIQHLTIGFCVEFTLLVAN